VAENAYLATLPDPARGRGIVVVMPGDMDDMKTDPTLRRFKGVAFHGDTPFDVPFVSQIADGLWQGGCVDGLVLPEWISHLVSLYPWKRYILKHPLKSELYVTMMDTQDQGFTEVSRLARWVNQCRRSGPTLVHCQAGLNRSALIVAKALHYKKFGDGEKILHHLRDTRSPAVLCNKAFEAEVLSWK
jgi:protein-tyrosine phosphatase